MTARWPARKGSQMGKLTEAQFSMQCAFIAKNAASWAGDILTNPEDYGKPADARTVARFTDEMRGRLDRLDEWAGRGEVAAPAKWQGVAEDIAGIEELAGMVGATFRPFGEAGDRPPGSVSPTGTAFGTDVSVGSLARMLIERLGLPSDVPYSETTLAEFLDARLGQPEHASPSPGGDMPSLRVRPLDETKNVGWMDEKGRFCRPLSCGYYVKFPAKDDPGPMFMAWHFTQPLGGSASYKETLLIAQEHHRRRVLGSLDYQPIASATAEAG